MPVSPYPRVQQATAVSITLAAETVIATSDDLPLSQTGGEGYEISGVANILAGTATTAVVLRVRQNSLTGTIIGAAATHTLAAAASASIPFSVVDTAAATSPPNLYVLTAQQTAGTGNGTANVVTIKVAPATSES